MATAMGGAWNYAVPADETTGSTKHAPYEDTSFGTSYAPPEKVGKTNSIQKRPSALDLQSDSETARTRRASMRTAHAPAARKTSRNALRDSARRDRSQRPEERVDDSAWIHRDKLAQIEIQEMEEAGFPLRLSRRSISADPETAPRRTSRSMSHSGARRSDSLERQNEIANDEDYAAAYPNNEGAGQTRNPPVHAVSDNGPHDRAANGQKDYSVRPPEESSSEQPFQRQHVLRPSTSRIPIIVPSAVGAMPESPNGQRKRSGSGAWTTKWDELAKEKGRSNSVSSHVLMDDPERTPPSSSANKTSSTEENSPPKSRVPKKIASNGRKTSISAAARPGSSHQTNKPGPRATSATSKRPGSSSGHKKTPSSSGYPESEAPWITSMYKPDPRLPPDQQMLPTHAKRMMQEQWEKEGKTGTVYDPEFPLLDDEEIQRPVAPPSPHPNDAPLDTSLTQSSPTKSIPNPKPSPNNDALSSGVGDDNAWPLTPLSDVRSENGSIRPGTSGGYRITPTIPSTPTIEKTVPSPPVALNPTPRVPDLPEKDEAQPRKGCCCVIM